MSAEELRDRDRGAAYPSCGPVEAPSAETTLLAESLREMREDFDRAFAVAASRSDRDSEALILVRISGESFAVRAKDATGLVRRTVITPVPTRIPALLGITAVRGELLPVYDTAALLGLQAAAGERSWLLIAGRETPVGFTFDELEGRLEIDPDRLYEADPTAAGKHLRGMARIAAAHLAIVDIPGLIEEIRGLVGRGSAGKDSYLHT